MKKKVEKVRKKKKIDFFAGKKSFGFNSGVV
jgi:hypothetical protein